jgi:phage shock protein E
MNFFKSLAQALAGKLTQALPPDALLIDVRSLGEFSSGHIDGAISLPLASIAQTISAVVPDKAAAVIVYCRSGARSSAAKRALARLGYENVSNGGGVRKLALTLRKEIRCA